jgi:hypothetical protein
MRESIRVYEYEYSASIDSERERVCYTIAWERDSATR